MNKVTARQMPSDEIKKYINNLYDSGARGTSDDPNGCTTLDEEYLTALFIQSTPKWLLENTSELDVKNELWDMLSDYMKCQTLETGSQILNYLVENAVALYQPKVKRLFEDRIEMDPTYGQQTQLRREEIKRDLYVVDKGRV